MDSTRSIHLIENGPEVAETGLVHRYSPPNGPGPYPTVVMVHGRYGSDDVMWIFRHVIPSPWLMVTPRAPVAESNRNFSWLTQSEDHWPGLEEFMPAVNALTRFIEALPRLYNADPERLYLMGFSQGAAVSFGTAFVKMGLVRGIASLVGFAPQIEHEAIGGAVSHMPVFMAVGTEDTRVPLNQSHRTADLLQAAGANLTYREYPTEHKLTPTGMKDLQSWWLEQT